MTSINLNEYYHQAARPRSKDQQERSLGFMEVMDLLFSVFNQSEFDKKKREYGISERTIIREKAPWAADIFEKINEIKSQSKNRTFQEASKIYLGLSGGDKSLLKTQITSSIKDTDPAMAKIHDVIEKCNKYPTIDAYTIINHCWNGATVNDKHLGNELKTINKIQEATGANTGVAILIKNSDAHYKEKLESDKNEPATNTKLDNFKSIHEEIMDKLPTRPDGTQAYKTGSPLYMAKAFEILAERGQQNIIHAHQQNTSDTWPISEHKQAVENMKKLNLAIPKKEADLIADWTKISGAPVLEDLAAKGITPSKIMPSNSQPTSP